MNPIFHKLAAIQAELKAPKSQFNEFGKYKYRKAEDILESMKPFLSRYGCSLTCSDDLVLVGERYYIKATATLSDAESGLSVSCTAYAREEEDKKGMDGSQITGASSSYARKYALNGLLCIDDTADSDTTNTGDSKPTPAPAPKTSRKAPAKAQNAPQTAPAPTADQLDLLPGGKTYKGIIRAYALGNPPKSGGDYRTAWIRATNAGDDLIEVFDHDVASFKLENNIQPAF